jgi:predicted TPR repeat methyltransferase
MPEKSGAINNEDDYDVSVKKFKWYGYDVVFGMMFENVKKGEKLLDLGIGTGLGSEPFHKAGLMIYGVDISQEMLDACERKGFAKELKVFDLSKHPFPYDDDQFDHMISVGVFNFFKDLNHFFSETRRLLAPNGTFGFTVVDHKGDEKIFTKKDENWDTLTYHHNRSYIEEMMTRYRFKCLKDLGFTAYDVDMNPMPMSAFVVTVGTDVDGSQT